MRPPKTHCYSLLLVGLSLFWGASSLVAFEDGFSYDKKFEGKYITAYCAPGMDLTRLAPQLNIRPSDEVLAGRSLSAQDSPGGEVAPLLATLFIQVSDLLDMHLYDLRIDIKVCGTDEELARLYKLFFGVAIEGRRSFYINELKTVYVAAEGFQPSIVGREISHAIISNYFGIPAPTTVQEVLSLYVEYSLKRQT